MNLYEMNVHVKNLLEQLFDTVDPETGEVNADVKAELDALTEERDTKLENIGLFIKRLDAESAAIKAEEDALKARRVSKEKMAERLKAYVSGSLLADGQMKFETARIAYSFRKSEAVNITGDVPKKYIVKTVTEKPDKKAITAVLKAGGTVRGAELVERQNLQIK